MTNHFVPHPLEELAPDHHHQLMHGPPPHGDVGSAWGPARSMKILCNVGSAISNRFTTTPCRTRASSTCWAFAPAASSSSA